MNKESLSTIVLCVAYLLHCTLKEQSIDDIVLQACHCPSNLPISSYKHDPKDGRPVISWYVSIAHCKMLLCWGRWTVSHDLHTWWLWSDHLPGWPSRTKSQQSPSFSHMDRATLSRMYVRSLPVSQVSAPGLSSPLKQGLWNQRHPVLNSSSAIHQVNSPPWVSLSFCVYKIELMIFWCLLGMLWIFFKIINRSIYKLNKCAVICHTLMAQFLKPKSSFFSKKKEIFGSLK